MSGESPSTRIFEALAHPYRRQLLFSLVETNPRDDRDLDPMDLLARGESDAVAVTQVGVIHTHLPKLDAMGFVEWDRESGEIARGPDWDEIAPLLQLMHGHRDQLPESWLSGPTGDDLAREE